MQAVKKGELPVEYSMVEYCFINDEVYMFYDPQFELVKTAINRGETPELMALVNSPKKEGSE